MDFGVSCVIPFKLFYLQLHSKSYVVKMFAETVARPDLHPDVARVLGTLCQLYAVCGITDDLGDFMQVSNL